MTGVDTPRIVYAVKTLSVRVELEVDDEQEPADKIADRLAHIAAAALDDQPGVTKILHAACVTRKR